MGALLVTTVATLAVAAIALLGPLEHGLRNAELKTLQRRMGHKEGQRFASLPSPLYEMNRATKQKLAGYVRQLEGLTQATVDVFGSPDLNGEDSFPIYQAHPDDGLSSGDPTIAATFATGRAHHRFLSIDGTEYVEVAIPFQQGQLHYTLIARKSIDQVSDAVGVVRRAFIDAALAGLALTLILGIPLSARLVRRLRTLREAALELAQEGPSVEVPIDRAHDEVGDLARTLAVMQQRLRSQEEARRSFVATASHELRTPLTSLDGMLELLADDLRYEDPDMEDARALLGRARAQSRRLGRLAADLLDLSRIDAQVELRSEPVELGELSRAVLAEFELGTEERGVHSQLDEHGGAVWALGDPSSIAQILRILLDNAVRITPAGAGIRISLRDSPDVAISVCDEGPGVAPEEREAIFDRFRRGRDTAGQAGFGLGLAIGRELAERMGGELVLEDGNGVGATFTLKLARAPASDPDPMAVA